MKTNKQLLTVVNKNLKALEQGAIKRLAFIVDQNTNTIAKEFALWYLKKNLSNNILYVACNDTKANKIVDSIAEQIKPNSFVKANRLGGALCGFGANLIVLDDPIFDLTALDSDIYKKRIKNWVSTSMLCRLFEDAIIFLTIMKSEKDNDIFDCLISEYDNENWTIIDLSYFKEK